MLRASMYLQAVSLFLFWGMIELIILGTGGLYLNGHVRRDDLLAGRIDLEAAAIILATVATWLLCVIARRLARKGTNSYVGNWRSQRFTPITSYTGTHNRRRRQPVVSPFESNVNDAAMKFASAKSTSPASRETIQGYIQSKQTTPNLKKD